MKLYTDVMAAHCRRFEEALPTYLPAAGTRQDTVVQAMTYACTDGGKRIRPVLTMEFCRLCCGDAARALPFAAGVEMIHSYSLVHDDLPCMDNSPLRRGKPAAHVAFGEAMALLTGDALLTRAFEVMLAAKDVSAEATVAAAKTLADAAGIMGMVGGQVIDLESEGKAIDRACLNALQDGKTAALLRAACAMGVIAGGGDAEKVAAATAFGEHIGLCFQITDDILDVTSTAQMMGKPVGSDAVNEKVTYVSLLGLDEAKRLAAENTAAAVKALAAFDGDTENLKTLAQALLVRDH